MTARKDSPAGGATATKERASEARKNRMRQRSLRVAAAVKANYLLSVRAR